MEAAGMVSSSVDRDCQRQHLSNVEQVYMVGRRSSPDLINDAADLLVECLHSEAGIPLQHLDQSTASGVFAAGVVESRAMSEATACMARVPSLSAILE